MMDQMYVSLASTLSQIHIVSHGHAIYGMYNVYFPLLCAYKQQQHDLHVCLCLS